MFSLNRRSNQLALVVVIGAQLALISRVGNAGGWRAARDVISPPRSAAAPAYDQWLRVRSQDPKPGTRFDLNAIVPEGERGVAPGRPLGLVVIGGCTQCALSTVKRWQALTPGIGRNHLLVLVAQGSQADAEAFWRANGLAVDHTGFPSDNWETQLNAFFRPRVYVFDRGGRLTFVQPVEQDVDAAIRAAKDSLLRLIHNGGNDDTR